MIKVNTQKNTHTQTLITLSYKTHYSHTKSCSLFSSQCTANTCQFWPHCTSQSTTCQSSSFIAYNTTNHNSDKNKIYVRSHGSNDHSAGSGPRTSPNKLLSKPPMIPVKVTSNNSIIFLGEREMPITRERNNYERTTGGTHQTSSGSNGATRITINGDGAANRGSAITNDPTRFYVSSRENKSR